MLSLCARVRLALSVSSLCLWAEGLKLFRDGKPGLGSGKMKHGKAFRSEKKMRMSTPDGEEEEEKREEDKGGNRKTKQAKKGKRTVKGDDAFVGIDQNDPTIQAFLSLSLSLSLIYTSLRS